VRYAGQSRVSVGTESIRNISGSIVFNHSTLELGNGVGFFVAANGSLSVSNSTIQNNVGSGISFDGGASLTVTSSNLVHNSIGIYLGTSTIAPILNQVIFSANNIGLQVSGGPARSSPGAAL